MIKRFLPLSNQIKLAVNIIPKILYIQKIYKPNQQNQYKTYYHFSQNHKISFEEGIDHIRQIEETMLVFNDLQDVFDKQLQIVEFLDDNLNNFDDKYMNIIYIRQILFLHQYQVAIYAYIKPQNPLNSKYTQKLINCELMKQLDTFNKFGFLEKQHTELLKIKLSIQLKAASIMCHMINYGVEADINQLHDWMNDYLDQIELYNTICLKIEVLCETISERQKYEFGESKDFYANFYFFIAQIHRKRNLMEEFERFIDQGIEEVKSQAQQQIKQPLREFELDLILANLFSLFVNFKQSEDIKQEYTLNFAIKIFDLLCTYWEITEEIHIVDMKVGFAQYFVLNNQFEKAAKLLQQVYDFTAILSDDDTLFLLFSNIYFCKQQGFMEKVEMNTLINQIDNLGLITLEDLVLYALGLNMCIFYDILETKDLEKIQLRFDKVIYYTNELCKLIKENKIKAFLPIFTWIDLIMMNDLLKNNEKFILSIYNVLNQFQDIELNLDRQNLEKDFYLIVLSFNFTNQITLDSSQKVKNVEKFANKYINNEQLQDIALNKLLLLNFQLIQEGKLNECLEIIDQLIPILQKEENLKKILSQFQSQKNKILNIKKNE